MDTSTNAERGLSLEREPLAEERVITRLTKEIRDLNRKIRAEDSKCAKLRATSVEIKERIAAEIEPARELLQLAIDEWAQQAVRVAALPRVSVRLKRRLGDLYWFFVGEQMEPRGELPAWFLADPTNTKMVEADEDCESDLEDDGFGDDEEELDAMFEEAIGAAFGEDGKARERLEESIKLWRGEGRDLTGTEQRELRKIYVRLAQLVHPDRANSEEERNRRTALMQQVNNAYRCGLATVLLEIEAAELRHERSGAGCVAVVAAEAEIEGLKERVTGLKGQLKRARVALRDLKESPMGEIVLDFQRMVKGGEDPLRSEQQMMKDKADMVREVLGALVKVEKKRKGGGEIEERFGMGLELARAAAVFGDEIFGG